MLTARQFEELIDIVAMCICDRKSYATLSEKQNADNKLRMKLNELCQAKLARKNDRLQDRRAGMIKHASEVLAS